MRFAVTLQLLTMLNLFLFTVPFLFLSAFLSLLHSCQFSLLLLSVYPPSLSFFFTIFLAGLYNINTFLQQRLKTFLTFPLASFPIFSPRFWLRNYFSRFIIPSPTNGPLLKKCTDTWSR